VCLWKLKGLFEAKIHPNKYLLFIRKIRFHHRKYFYLSFELHPAPHRIRERVRI
jgi:hypothetical protein